MLFEGRGLWCTPGGPVMGDCGHLAGMTLFTAVEEWETVLCDLTFE